MKNKTRLNQAGIASIIVTMFIMVVIGLLVLGFAKITRREQRQSLDRQLNTQAFYAAESGAHDAQDYINAQLNLGNPPSTYTVTTCTGPTSFPVKASVSNTIDATTSYSCVLIDPTPTDLEWTYVSEGGSVTFPVKPGPGLTIDTITFGWHDPGATSPTYTSGCANSLTPSTLPKVTTTDWTCEAGALRVDITSLKNLTRDDLINNTINAVLYPAVPSSGFTSLPYATVQAAGIHGAIGGVKCNPAATPRHCSVTITGLDGAFPANTGGYYVRIRPIYRAASIYINGELAFGAGTAKLVGAQAVVDVTGKATDILKRLRVRVPITGSGTKENTIFDYAIESADSICKVYGVIPPSIVNNLSPIPDPSCASPL
jgi:hypothetical protein